MVSTTLPRDVQLGVQRPRIEAVPPARSSAGEEAVELAARAGLHLDPWQQYVLDRALGEGDDGRWAAFEVGLLVARQNGKGSILEARELAGLFLFGERLIIHSAHLFETSMEHFLRILQLIEATPELDRRVKRVSRAHGEEGIQLKSGQRLKFKTRTKGGGRGLSGDLVVLDEAMELPDAAMSALMPTLSARPNPQLWYAGSAVDQTVHGHGVVLARVRERGMSGDDPSLAYLEWSVDPDVYNAAPETVASDPEAWAQANPGLGIRISGEYVANEQRSLDPRGFATERLTVGDWPDVSEGADQVIAASTWRRLADPTSTLDGQVAFAVDTTPERDWTAIVAGGVRADGRKHVEITGDADGLDHRPGTRWVVPRLLELIERWQPCAVMIDSRSPAASLIPELEQAGVKVTSGPPDPDHLLVKATTADMVQACGGFFDAATSDLLRHLGQEQLGRALASAKRRSLGDAWAWARKSGGDISPLVAATLASHAHTLYGHQQAATPFFLT